MSIDYDFGHVGSKFVRKSQYSLAYLYLSLLRTQINIANFPVSVDLSKDYIFVRPKRITTHNFSLLKKREI